MGPGYVQLARRGYENYHYLPFGPAYGNWLNVCGPASGSSAQPAVQRAAGKGVNRLAPIWLCGLRLTCFVKSRVVPGRLRRSSDATLARGGCQLSMGACCPQLISHLITGYIPQCGIYPGCRRFVSSPTPSPNKGERSDTLWGLRAMAKSL